MYEERFYRRISRPSDLNCYEVHVKETDLLCCTVAGLKDFIRDRVLFYRHQLETYIDRRPEFEKSLIPVTEDPFAPAIVKAMISAALTIGIGPMATVAGAIAEFVGKDILGLSEEFIIENGGDIYLKTKRDRISMVYAKKSVFSEKIGIRLKAGEKPYGLCTSSGTVGHSISFGAADAVCVLGDSSLFADGLATHIGNIVKKKGDIPLAIEVAKRFQGIRGMLVVLGESIGAWGDIELVTM